MLTYFSVCVFMYLSSLCNKGREPVCCVSCPITVLLLMKCLFGWLLSVCLWYNGFIIVPLCTKRSDLYRCCLFLVIEPSPLSRTVEIWLVPVVPDVPVRRVLPWRSKNTHSASLRLHLGDFAGWQPARQQQ